MVYAPSPKKKLWPIEICPLYPMMIIKPRMATLYAATFAKLRIW